MSRLGESGPSAPTPRRPDGWEVEHDLDPQDMADAYVELVDQGYLDARLEQFEDDWWAEPLTSKFRNYVFKQIYRWDR